MKSRHLLISLAFVTFALLAFDSFAPAGQDKKADQDKKAEQPKKKNSAVIPTPFQPKRHDGFLAIAKKGDIDILLMGDSITDGWRNTGKAVYAKHFEPLKTANFGIGGDTTQGVLWRMDNGELDGYTPKLMMLMIGTNNIGRNTSEEIAEGINAVVGRFRKKHDKAKVLLLAVFPRTLKGKGLQPKVKEINDIIAKSHDGKSIFYLDIGEKFLDKTGTIPLDVMKDGLHPTAKGYEIWAEAVMPKVYELIGRKADQDKKSDQPKKDAQEKKKNTAIIPTEGGLAKRHAGFMEIAKKGNIDILLMGDSITDGWRNTGKAVFAKHFEPLKTANFGISGDVTQGVLWRMDNGELDGYSPKLMMLMIGTNNISRMNTPEEIAEGISAVVDRFRKKHSNAKVLLLAVFPRSGGKGGGLNKTVPEINKIIAKSHDGKSIHYLDIGEKFLDKSGNIPVDIMKDGLHPTAKGYEIWAEAVMPKVHELIGIKK